MSLPKIEDVISQIRRDEFLASYGIMRCMHCKKSWGVVEKKIIPCPSDKCLTVVCTHCFETLSVDQIIVYVNEQENWRASELGSRNYDNLRESAAEAVRRMKQQPAV